MHQVLKPSLELDCEKKKKIEKKGKGRPCILFSDFYEITCKFLPTFATRTYGKQLTTPCAPSRFLPLLRFVFSPLQAARRSYFREFTTRTPVRAIHSLPFVTNRYSKYDRNEICKLHVAKEKKLKADTLEISIPLCFITSQVQVNNFKSKFLQSFRIKVLTRYVM